MDQYNYKYGNGYLDEKKKTNVPLLNWYANTVKEILLSWQGRFVGKKREKVWRTAHYAFFGLIGRIVTT